MSNSQLVELTLEDYEPLLQKANMEESKNPAKSLKMLHQCLRLMQRDYNRFLERYPKRKADVILIQNRIAYMERVLKISVDDYQELDKHLKNAKIHRAQDKLHLLLIDYQQIIFRADKLKMTEYKNQYQKILADTQIEYDELILKLKDAENNVAKAQTEKNYPSILSNIQIILDLAPKIGKDDLIAKYQKIYQETETEFSSQQKEVAEQERLKRDAAAAEKKRLDEERKAKEDADRKAMEESEQKLRQEMEEKRKAAAEKKRQEEEAKIQQEAEKTLSTKQDSIQTTKNELNTTLKQVHKINMKKLDPSKIQKLSIAETESLSVEQIQDMSEEQIVNFTPTQTQSLTTMQIRAMKPNQLQALNSEQFKEFALRQYQAFTPEQIQALTPGQLADFEPEQWQAFSIDQIPQFTPEQFKSLSPEALQAFEPDQIQIMTNTQIKSVLPKITPEFAQYLTIKQTQQTLDELTSEDLKVIPLEKIQILTQTPKKCKADYVQWTTRILKNESEQLILNGPKLMDSNKIERNNRAQLTRYALKMLNEFLAGKTKK